MEKGCQMSKYPTGYNYLLWDKNKNVLYIWNFCMLTWLKSRCVNMLKAHFFRSLAKMPETATHDRGMWQTCYICPGQLSCCDICAALSEVDKTSEASILMMPNHWL